MNVVSTDLPEVKYIEPKVFGDHRGFFVETYQKDRYQQQGIAADFVQDNLSKSSRGVLRGLHLQNPNCQGKLVSVIEGEVFDVAVDVRLGSPRFGKWVGFHLNADQKNQLWIPKGFAHGFDVTSETAIFAYKCDAYYAPENEISIAWDDPKIGIKWPIAEPKLSAKDQSGLALESLSSEHLPAYEGS